MLSFKFRHSLNSCTVEKVCQEDGTACLLKKKEYRKWFWASPECEDSRGIPYELALHLAGKGLTFLRKMTRRVIVSMSRPTISDQLLEGNKQGTLVWWRWPSVSCRHQNILLQSGVKHVQLSAKGLAFDMQHFHTGLGKILPEILEHYY